MRLLFTFLFIASIATSYTQIDINALYGNWCVYKVLNAPDIEEVIPVDELNEMAQDLAEVIFHFSKDNKFAVIEPGMTILEALEGALTFTYVKGDQVLEMEDEYTGDLIIIELVKITKTEMVFRSYESGIGFELYFKKC
jgi:hypothetical protein